MRFHFAGESRILRAFCTIWISAAVTSGLASESSCALANAAKNIKVTAGKGILMFAA